ncbi:hypothetical protein Tco_0440146 [Tanacetum coccineum]
MATNTLSMCGEGFFYTLSLLLGTWAFLMGRAWLNLGFEPDTWTILDYIPSSLTISPNVEVFFDLPNVDDMTFELRLLLIQRISLTGFPAQSVGSSNTDVLDSPCLLVLITGTSQSRQHGKSESDSYYLSD